MQIAELVTRSPPQDCLTSRPNQHQVFVFCFNDDRRTSVETQDISILQLDAARQRHPKMLSRYGLCGKMGPRTFLRGQFEVIYLGNLIEIPDLAQNRANDGHGIT